MYYKKLLIANRGEIAIRISRTARKLGIHTIAVHSHADRESYHVKESDEAYILKGDTLAETYLNKEKLIEIAKNTGAEAIHPGYGFLAENAEFARLCKEAGIHFIGPSAEAIVLMGNKINARKFVESLNIPVLEGTVGNEKEIIKECQNMQFPLLVKAAAGGGGKGMRIVHHPKELTDAIRSTKREAKAYFGDGAVLVERYIENPRHIEVQVLADNHGNVVHLFERECSVQRRFQKIIEEAPSATINEVLRKKMGAAAVKIAREMNYRNAGTIEFLVDEGLNFYFLEMNTRIQVEHAVTEMITGLDLVEEQLAIASGRALQYKQEDILRKGHAIEARIYAEDPANNFLPAPGTIVFYEEPNGRKQHIRIDSALGGPGTVHPDYDPMIAKLVVWDENRQLAIEQLHHALNAFHIHGIITNIPYLKTLINTTYFKKNQITTLFCQQHAKELQELMIKECNQVPHVLFLVAFCLFDLTSKQTQNIWEEIGYWRQNGKKFLLRLDEVEYSIEITGNDPYTCRINEKEYLVENITINTHHLTFEFENSKRSVTMSQHPLGGRYLEYEGICHWVKRLDVLEKEEWTDSDFVQHEQQNSKIVSPLPGKVVKINVKTGEKVKKGTTLLIIEAMKMENSILAPRDTFVEQVLVKEGQQVKNNMELIQLVDADKEK